MSSIPLVALSVRPTATPQDLQAQQMQLKNLSGQNAMIPGALQEQQNQVQLGQQAVQQGQFAVQDRQAGMKAMQQWDGKDPNQLPDLVRQNGGSLNAVVSTKAAITKAQQDVQALNKAQLDNQATKTNYLLGQLQAATDPKVPDSELVGSVQKAIQNSGRDGYLAPEEGQQIQQMLQQFPNPADLRAHLALHEKSLVAASTQFSQEQATREANVKAQEANAQDWKTFPTLGVALNTRTGESQTPAGQVLTPEMMQSKYVGIQQKQSLGQQLTPEEQAFSGAYKNFKTLVPAFGILATQGALQTPQPISPGTTGQAALAQMNPQVASMVKAVGEYRQKSSDITQRMNPASKANFLTALNAAYPNYDENEFPARSKMVADYTSGGGATQINAINTALGHAGVLNDSIDALNNGDVKLLNSIANKLQVQLGGTPVATFNTIVHRVGPELAAAYIQGGGGEGERGTTAADFDPDLGPETLKSNTAITARLLRSKIGPLENQWQTTMKPGTPDQSFQSRFLTPEAQGTLAKLSPATAPKILSMATIQKAAQDHGVSVDEAKRQAQAAGYTIQ